MKSEPRNKREHKTNQVVPRLTRRMAASLFIVVMATLLKKARVNSYCDDGHVESACLQDGSEDWVTKVLLILVEDKSNNNTTRL